VTSRRRLFLASAAALLTMPFARAQAPDKVRRLGWLMAGSPKSHGRVLEAFREGMRERGWVEGRNMTLELRWAEGKLERLPALAAELVRLNPEVIITAATAVHLAVKKQTSTIPIVMATGADPIAAGLVDSLARPGSNVTGLTGFFEATPVKMLELAAALVPRGARVSLLIDVNGPFFRGEHRGDAERAIEAFGFRAQYHVVGSGEEVTRAFAALDKNPPAVLVVLPGPMFFALGERMVKSASALGVPAICPFEEWVDAGTLMSYAIDTKESYRRAAGYVDKILKGAKPADLPIEQPTRLSLAVNLKTAKQLGITIPAAVLARADRVIE
jgi:putative ABC transport system substrate-binding protein